MTSIAEVRLRGFQSHVTSNFHLGPGLNVITGPSDAGKTAIIRAVRWVAFNEPAGEAFVNEAVGEAEVRICLDNGVTIEKRRRRGKTAYVLQLAPNAEPQIFEKSEVPEDIKTVLGIVKHAFGDFVTALNFAFQLDAPFLISEPASAGAKMLGKIAGTEVVDLAIKSTAKENYRVNQDRLQANKDIERIEQELTEFEDLEALKEQLEACEYLVGQIDKAVATKNRLQGLNDGYSAAALRTAAVAAELDRLAIVKDLEIDLLNIEKAQQRYDTLLGLYGQLRRLETSIADLATTLDTYTEIDRLFAEVATLEQDYKRQSLLSSLSTVYAKHTNEVNRIDNILTATADLDVANELLSLVATAEARLDKLRKIAVAYKNNAALISRYQNAIDLTVNVRQAADILTGINAGRERLQRLTAVKTLYEVKQRTYIQANDRLAQAIKDERRYTDELAGIWASVKVCPLCEQPVKGGPRQ